MLYSHRNVWANFRLLGQPNTFLGAGRGICERDAVRAAAAHRMMAPLEGPGRNFRDAALWQWNEARPA